jgi:hypothetical protein
MYANIWYEYFKEKRTLERCRRRYEDTIKMVLKNVAITQAMEQ